VPGFDPVWDTKLASPDGAHEALLTYVDEIPWGERYYHLVLDGARFGRQIFTDRHLWILGSADLVIEEWIFDEGYPWPKRSRLVLLDVMCPPLQFTLAELYRGDDPAKLREGYPTLDPVGWSDGLLTYESRELAPNGRDVESVVHQLRITRITRPPELNDLYP
jgi:hypothetical protein